MSDAIKALNVLNPSQLEFIKEETGLDEEDIKKMTDDEFAELYDQIADIEIEEVCSAGDEEISERGNIAADIVTAVGEELYYDDSAESDEEKK